MNAIVSLDIFFVDTNAPISHFATAKAVKDRCTFVQENCELVTLHLVFRGGMRCMLGILAHLGATPFSSVFLTKSANVPSNVSKCVAHVRRRATTVQRCDKRAAEVPACRHHHFSNPFTTLKFGKQPPRQLYPCHLRTFVAALASPSCVSSRTCHNKRSDKKFVNMYEFASRAVSDLSLIHI